MGSGLGRNDAEDAVAKRGLDVVLVDAGWEAEGAVELAVGAFSHPVGRFIVGLSCLGRSHDSARVGVGSLAVIRGGIIIILDGYFVRLGVGFVLVAVGHLAVDTAAHDQGMRVGEFDVHILSVEPGELAL